MAYLRSASVNFILLTVMALLLFSACDQIPGSARSEPEMTTTAGAVTHIGQRVDLDCGGSDFRLFRVSLEAGREAVTLFKGPDELRTEILPAPNEVKKFKLDPLRKTDDGFEMSVEYGDRYYHTKRFEFECDEGEFVFAKLRSERFDTRNPSRISKKESAVKPRTTWERFGLRLYLID